MINIQKKVIGGLELTVQTTAKIMINGRSIGVDSFLAIERAVIAEMSDNFPAHNPQFDEMVRNYSSEMMKRLPAGHQITPEDLSQRMHALRMYMRYLVEEPALITAVAPIPADSGIFRTWAEVERIKLTSQQEARNISGTVVGKLGGGLGTTQGMEHSKGFLKVEGDITIFDIFKMQLRQLKRKIGDEGSVQALILVSEFTDKDVQSQLVELDPPDVQISYFDQRLAPRVDPTSKLPCRVEDSDSGAPGGHGEIYSILAARLPELKQMFRDGREFLNISNIDNYHGDIDPRIVEFMRLNGKKMVIEALKPLQSDVKGGKFAVVEGRAALVEAGNTSKDLKDTLFNDKNPVDDSYLFNTNDIWFDLAWLVEQLETKGAPDLPIILNKKPFGDGKEGCQLEIAMGTFMPTEVCLLVVERERFGPIKKNSDLMVRRALDHVDTATGKVHFSSARMDAIQAGQVRDWVPGCDLPAAYDKISDFERLVTHVPNLDLADYFGVVKKDPKVLGQSDTLILFDNPRLSIEGTVQIDGTELGGLPIRIEGDVALRNVKLKLLPNGEIRAINVSRSRLDVIHENLDEPVVDLHPLRLRHDAEDNEYVLSRA